MTRRRRARREDLGLSTAEFAVLRRLDTPEKIQDFLFRLKQNFEPNGDSCRPVRVVLRERNAHCIEGAMFASAEYRRFGLPVVTTHNAGGRNWFFSNGYVIFCDDDVAAVVPHPRRR